MGISFSICSEFLDLKRKNINKIKNVRHKIEIKIFAENKKNRKTKIVDRKKKIKFFLSVFLDNLKFFENKSKTPKIKHKLAMLEPKILLYENSKGELLENTENKETNNSGKEVPIAKIKTPIINLDKFNFKPREEEEDIK